jgi:hypothetical protein
MDEEIEDKQHQRGRQQARENDIRDHEIIAPAMAYPDSSIG